MRITWVGSGLRGGPRLVHRAARSEVGPGAGTPTLGRMDAWGSLLALLAKQHGVVALRQVIELGIAPRSFRRRARKEGWIEHGSTLWSPPDTELDQWGLAMAAALAGGDHALVTGQAALRLHGLDVPFPTPVRIVTPMQRHAVRSVDPEQVKVIASRTLRPADGTTLRRVPLTTVDRSFLDLVIPPTPAITPVRDALITATQTGLTTASAVHDRVTRARGLPGAGVLRRALADIGSTGADSPFSHRVASRLLREGLRPDRSPVPVATPGRTLHPDITFCDHRVCIECDGLRWHRTQKDLAIDHRKDRRYRDAGWICLRIGWWEFDHGWPTFVHDLRDVLAGATG